jgi:hypothetical protein
MELSVNDQVKVSGPILTKESQVVSVSDEPAVVKKLDGEYIYIQTQYGTHYVAITQLKK